jgi:hypothetical protein
MLAWIVNDGVGGMIASHVGTYVVPIAAQVPRATSAVNITVMIVELLPNAVAVKQSSLATNVPRMLLVRSA